MGKFDKNRRYTLKSDFAYKGKKYKGSDSLVAFFKFQNGQPVDQSLNRIAASYEGAPTISSNRIGSRVVSAAAFSDSSNINAKAVDAKFSFSSLASGASETAGSDLPFSISLWVKVDSTASGVNYFFAKDGNSHEYHAVYDTSNQKVTFLICNDDGTKSISVQTEALSIANKWTNFVFTYSGGTATASAAYAASALKVYINGQLQTTTGNANNTFISMEPEHDQPLYIGASSSGSDELDGSVAEFAVWSKMLSQDEVAALYGVAKGRKTGFLNNPLKVLLAEKDAEAGSYPLRIQNNKKQMYNQGTLFFNDSIQQEKISPFSTAIVDMWDYHWMDLTSSDGKTKKRFVWSHDIFFKLKEKKRVDTVHRLYSASYVPVMFRKASQNRLKTPFNHVQYKFAKVEAFAHTINAFFNEEPVDTLTGVDYFKNIFTIKAETISPREIKLTHTTKLTGSFKLDGNFINCGKFSKYPAHDENRRGGNEVRLKSAKPFTHKDNYLPRRVEYNLKSRTPAEDEFVKQFSEYSETKVSFPSMTKTLGENESNIGLVSSPNRDSDISLNIESQVLDQDVVVKSGDIFQVSPFDDSQFFPDNRIEFFNQSREDDVEDGLIFPGMRGALLAKEKITIDCTTKGDISTKNYVFYSTGSSGKFHPAISNKAGSGMAYWNNALGKWEMLANAEIDYDLNVNFKSVDGFKYKSSKNLQSWWRMELLDGTVKSTTDYGSVKDSGPQKNHLTVTASSEAPTGDSAFGMPKVATRGALGSGPSAFFDEDALFNRSSDLSNSSTESAVSIAAWVNIQSSRSHVILDTFSDRNDGLEFHITAGNLIQLIVYDSRGPTFGGLNNGYTTSNHLTSGKWHHIVATYDGGGSGGASRKSIKIYVDGISRPVTQGQAGSYSANNLRDRKLVLGNRGDNWQGPPARRAFLGRILEVAVWDIELTSDEVRALYQQRNAIPEIYSPSNQLRKLSCLGFAPQSPGDAMLHNIESQSSVGQPVSQFGFPKAIQYNATSSQAIKMSDYISAPFLVSKIWVEMNGVFGLCENANTGSQKLSRDRGLNNPIQKQFFLLNQYGNADRPNFVKDFDVHAKHSQVGTNKKLVADSSVKVTQAGFRELIGYSKISFINSGSLAAKMLDKTEAIKDQRGLTDKLVLVPENNFKTNFGHTGSISFGLVPSVPVINDFIAPVKSKGKSGSLLYREEFALSNEGGNTLDGVASGRTTYNPMFSEDHVKHETFLGFRKTRKYYTRQRRQSPYLLRPEDSLVIGWQNHPFSVANSGSIAANFINSGSVTSGVSYDKAANLAFWYRFKDFRVISGSIKESIRRVASSSLTRENVFQSVNGPRRNYAGLEFFEKTQNGLVAIKMKKPQSLAVKGGSDSALYASDNTVCNLAESSGEKDFSISFWLYHVEHGTPSNSKIVAGKTRGGSSYGDIQYWIKANSSTEQIIIELSDKQSSNFTNYIIRQGTSANGSLSTKAWHHVVITYDKDESAARCLKIYINGEDKTLSSAEAKGGTLSGGSWQGMEGSDTSKGYGAKFQIGSNSTHASFVGFKGQIAEFAQWNTTLSPENVYAIYSADPYGLIGTVDKPTEFSLGEKVVDRLGSVKLHLFGSFVSQNETLDEPQADNLSSNAIHEYIGEGRSVESHDTDKLGLLSGSMVDNVIKNASTEVDHFFDYGMFPGGAVAGVDENPLRIAKAVFEQRGRVGSALSGKFGATGSINRFIKVKNKSVFYSDSIVPHLAFPFRLLTSTWENSKINLGPSDIVQAITFIGESSQRNAAVLSNDPSHPSNLWFRSFNVNFNTLFDLNVVSNNTEIQDSENTVFRLRDAEKVKNDDNSSVGAFGVLGSHFLDTRGRDNFTMPIDGNSLLGEKRNVFLAFDMSKDNTLDGSRVYLPWSGSNAFRNQSYNFKNLMGIDHEIRAPLRITNNNLDAKYELRKIFYSTTAGFDRQKGILPVTVDNHGKISTRLRSYKYGLHNVVPENPEYIFKRDHFGFFRDMIESPPESQLAIRPPSEALDTAADLEGQFIQATTPPVFVRFLDDNLDPVDPEDTPSQNLSFFCTSSVPYFDNQTKDRFTPYPDDDEQLLVSGAPDVEEDPGDGSGQV